MTPGPRGSHALSLSANDDSLRVVGYVGTSDPITLGEGEPTAVEIDGVSNFIAAYKSCP